MNFIKNPPKIILNLIAILNHPLLLIRKNKSVKKRNVIISKNRVNRRQIIFMIILITTKNNFSICNQPLVQELNQFYRIIINLIVTNSLKEVIRK